LAVLSSSWRWTKSAAKIKAKVKTVGTELQIYKNHVVEQLGN